LTRIALVNDVRLAIEVLRRIVDSLPDAEVAWTAENGQEATEKCAADLPDLVLMDLIMPVMDGVEAVRRIMARNPCPILIVTATVSGNCNKVFEALGHGALDAVNTPIVGRGGDVSGGEELVRKIRNIARLKFGTARGLHFTTAAVAPAGPPGATPLLVIGASTGGPHALSEVLAGIAPNEGFSTVVVQHLDQQFVPGLVEWLAQESKTKVRKIVAGDRPESGAIHVACTADHLTLSPGGVFQYVREPAEHVYRPSVDVFFESLLRARVRSGVALLLTGMGRDGATGMKALHDAGWRTIAQDRASSVVWGMPGAAVGLHAADEVLPLDRISGVVSEWMKSSIGQSGAQR
jgi:two-component system response regulator WspF